MIFNPWPYQHKAFTHCIDNPAAGLIMDMGLGKTVVSCMVVDELMYNRFSVNKTLVIAPLEVCKSVWHKEIEKWDQIKHLRISKVLGVEKKRRQALLVDADIYIINRENVDWLVGEYGADFPFDMLIIDELSSFKSEKAQRFKALKTIRPKIKRVIGLTGTPAPNSLLDLWPQMFLLDQGKRLGKTMGMFRDFYFKPNKRNGGQVFSYTLRDQQTDAEKQAVKVKQNPFVTPLNDKGHSPAEQDIYDRISDICISMKKEDYLDMPPLINNIVPVELSGEALARYDQFERDSVLALPEEKNGEVISAVNAASLTQKLLQFASGAVYNQDQITGKSDGTFSIFHEAKLDRLEEIIDTLNGSPLLISYWFKHSEERILNRLRKYKPKNIKDKGVLDLWNIGEVPVALGHPMSIGHGLNLQAGGNNSLWFDNTWSLEYYQQFVARLYRQGQLYPVINNRLVAGGTIDEKVIEVIDDKDANQNKLFKAIAAIVLKHKS